MLVLLISVWIIVLILWYWMQRRRLVKMGSLIPGPKGYPVIGNGLTFWGKPEEVFMRLRSISVQYPRMVSLWIGPQLHVVFFDPRDVGVLLRSRSCEKADEYKFLKPWLGDGLLISGGAKFKQNKKLIIPSFHINNLKHFVDVFNDHALLLVRDLEGDVNKEEFDVQHRLSTCTMDVLLETVLGICKETLGPEALTYANAVEKLGRLAHMRVYKFWLRPELVFRFSSLKRKQDVYLKIVHGLTERVIGERKQLYEDTKKQTEEDDRQERPQKRSAVFLDNLLQARDENGIGLTDDDIKAEVMTMMFAGQDTTTATVGFVLSMLGIHQHVQDKVITELDEVFGDSKCKITYEDTLKLKYLEQVIQETWRLFPPIPLIAKKPNQDVQLENCSLPAGCTAVIIIMSLHRNPEQYTNPHTFDPDNFLPEKVKMRHPYSFIPFSSGSRTCIGNKYATLLVKVILATLLRHYKIYSKKRQRDFVLAGQTVLKRKEGYPICLKLRNHKHSQQISTDAA